MREFLGKEEDLSERENGVAAELKHIRREEA
jgi:hypothetical protein